LARTALQRATLLGIVMPVVQVWRRPFRPSKSKTGRREAQLLGLGKTRAEHAGFSLPGIQTHGISPAPDCTEHSHDVEMASTLAVVHNVLLRLAFQAFCAAQLWRNSGCFGVRLFGQLWRNSVPLLVADRLREVWRNSGCFLGE